VSSSTLRTGRHGVHLLHVHLVFVTKYRRGLFSAQHLARLEEVLTAVCTDFECDLVECNGDHDHVHLLITYPPKTAPARLVNSLKGVSARRPRQQFPAPEHHLWRGHLWSPSYSANSVAGPPPSVPRQHIQDQQSPVEASPPSPIPPPPQGGSISAKEVR